MQPNEHIDIQPQNNQSHICNIADYNRERGVLYNINGCTVSITSTPKGSDETLKAIKDILLYSYRAKTQKA